MSPLGLARCCREASPPKLFDELAAGNISIVAMAKSKDKRSAKTDTPKKSHKSDSSFIKVDKKAFDPALASLFATSVRLSHVRTKE
jgi:hypothetical protein